MIQRSETEREKTEVASVGAMDDPVPSEFYGIHSETDDPAVRETGGNQESRQARRIGEMVFVQTGYPLRSSNQVSWSQIPDTQGYSALITGL